MPVGNYCRQPARTITRKENVCTAAEWMDGQSVGALVVVDGARPVGLLTDRDVALRVLAEGRDARATSVGELATEAPVTLPADLPLPEAATRMRRLGLRRMPVVDGDGNLVGMLAVDDLVRLVATELGELADVAAEQVPHEAPPVQEAVRSAVHYAKEVVSVDRETPAREVAQRMRSQCVGSVVVVDASGGPVGILTDRDLTRRIVAKGVDPLTPASEIMSRGPATVDAGERLQHVARVMRENGVRRIPVVSEGRLVGIVTYDDLLVALGRELHDIGEAARAGIRRERVSAHAERVRAEVEGAVESLSERIEQLEDETRTALRDHLDALRERLHTSD